MASTWASCDKALLVSIICSVDFFYPDIHIDHADYAAHTQKKYPHSVSSVNVVPSRKCSIYAAIFGVKLTFEMLTVRGQQHSFSSYQGQTFAVPCFLILALAI